MDKDIIVGLVESLCDSIYVLDVFLNIKECKYGCARIPLKIEENSPYYQELMSGTVVRVRVHKEPDSDDSYYAILDVEDGCSTNRPPILGQPGSAITASFSLACEYRLDPCFPRDVMAEVATIMKNPGINDPRLVDMTDVPFVTVDGQDSQDLDQAMHISREGDGTFVVRYALADASYYVRPGTALFREALRRGGSVYLPGLCIPMLPAELSEDIISLLEGVPRRSVVFEMRVDGKTAALLSTQVYRARIVNHKKLSYEDVDEFHCPGSDIAKRFAEEPFAETLRLLKEFGELRIGAQNAKNVLSLQRVNCTVSTGNSVSTIFSLITDERLNSEKWNEQLSQICNIAGAKLLVEAGETNEINGIWILSQAPSKKTYDSIEDYIKKIAQIHGEADNSRWLWRRDSETLAAYIARLPRITVGASASPELSRAGRISRALNRAAMMCCQPSEVKPVPGMHYGIGAEAYARFSAPMRQIEGVFLHMELLKTLDHTKTASLVSKDKVTSTPSIVKTVTDSQPQDTDKPTILIENDDTDAKPLKLSHDSEGENAPTIEIELDNDTEEVLPEMDTSGDSEVFELGRVISNAESELKTSILSISASLNFMIPKDTMTPDAKKLRDDVISAADAVKKTQGRVTKAANKVALDTVFASDLMWPEFARPIRRGTILGLSKDKNRAYVELDNPPVEVKIYLNALTSATNNAARISHSVTSFEIGKKTYRVGDEIGVRVIKASNSAIKWANNDTPKQVEQEGACKKETPSKKANKQPQKQPEEATSAQAEKKKKEEVKATPKKDDETKIVPQKDNEPKGGEKPVECKQESKKPKKQQPAKQEKQPKQKQQQQQKAQQKTADTEQELWILEPISVDRAEKRGLSKPHWTKEMNKLALSGSISIGTPMHPIKPFSDKQQIKI